MAKTRKAKPDVYQVITDRVVELLESGSVPWRRPWQTTGTGVPRNLASGKAYRGINVFILACLGGGYGCDHWVTFKQAKDLGGSVRKGEKGLPVVFWTWYDKKRKDGSGESDRFPCLRYYTVFNVRQCEGLEDRLPAPDLDLADHDPIAECEAIAGAFRAGPDVVHGGDRACYNPLADRINVPELARFESPEEYYSTLFHEFGHSTGHKSRLDRDMSGLFGDHSYSKEELIAEMTAAFLCAMGGIDGATLDNQAAYVRGWLGKIRGDKKLVVQAAAAAQKAADHILGVTWGEESEAASEAGKAAA